MDDHEKLRPRHAFVTQIENACLKLDAKLTWHSDSWIAEIESDWRRFFLIGQTFPLNDAASANIANDKVGTWTILAAENVPAVPHHLVRFAQLISLPGAGDHIRSVAGLPVVLKPHKDSAGTDVMRACDDAELMSALQVLAVKYRAIGASPFVNIISETRVVTLDSEVLLTYQKLIPDGPEWRHNLCLGATPRVISAQDRDPRLAELSKSAIAALGLRFATVDIVDVDGELFVLEVNSGVTLEHFSRAGAEQAAAAEEIYWRALQACVADAHA